MLTYTCAMGSTIRHALSLRGKRHKERGNSECGGNYRTLNHKLTSDVGLDPVTQRAASASVPLVPSTYATVVKRK